MMMAVCLSMTASFIAFLRYNVSKDKRIFLGDSGSLFIGFFVAAIVINILTKDYHEELNMTFISNLPLLIISALFIPVFDSIRVFTIRIQNGRNPFAPDRTHVHHVILDYFKLSHRKASFYIVSANALILLVMGFVTEYCNHLISLITLLALSAILAVVLHKMRMKLPKKGV
jgi:UDP-N-acetylmuramyl pentapeptide phosphotransferase/UDP-N-acetylglucosamine-1-phosphate transferase